MKEKGEFPILIFNQLAPYYDENTARAILSPNNMVQHGGNNAPPQNAGQQFYLPYDPSSSPSPPMAHAQMSPSKVNSGLGNGVSLRPPSRAKQISSAVKIVDPTTGRGMKHW